MPKITPPVQVDLKVRFFCSATLELTSSLHVLSNPEHHISCLRWYEKTTKSIKPKLLSRIQDFGRRYTHWSFVMDIIDIMVDSEVQGSSLRDDFDEIYKKIRKMDDGLFIYIFLGETLVSNERDLTRIKMSQETIQQIDLTSVYPFIEKQIVESFLRNYAEVKEEMLSIMKEYHDSVFVAHWEKYHHRYAAAVEKEKKNFASKMPMEYILSLHRDLALEDDVIYMRKEADLSLDVRELEEVRLFFSMFTYPHLMATIIGKTISIYANMIFPQLSADEELLASGIKSLSDVTRLTILRLASGHPTTNKELAHLLNITPASISQHMRILRELNFINCRRDKNNIYYTINSPAILDVLKASSDFLGLEQS